MVREVGGEVLIVLTSTQRRGAEIEGHALGAALRDAGLAVEVVALSPASSGTGLDLPVLGRRSRSPSGWWRLRRRARRHDVVVAYGSSTLPAAALALLGTGVPFVYRSIGDPGRWAGRRARRARTGWMMRRAAGVVALWPAAGQAIVDLYGVHPADVTVIPNGRDPAVFAPPTDADRARSRHTIGLPGDATVIASIGALSQEKRPLLAVDVASRVPGAWLLMAGDGPLTEATTRAASAALPGRHLMLGQVTDVRPVLAAADLVLLCSATEGMPGVIIEAEMMGRRIVATDVGACAHLLAPDQTCPPGRGIVGAGEAPSAIAGTVLRVLGEDEPAADPTWALQPAVDRWRELLIRLADGQVQEGQ